MEENLVFCFLVVACDQFRREMAFPTHNWQTSHRTKLGLMPPFQSVHNGFQCHWGYVRQMPLVFIQDFLVAAKKTAPSPSDEVSVLIFVLVSRSYWARTLGEDTSSFSLQKALSWLGFHYSISTPIVFIVFYCKIRLARTYGILADPVTYHDAQCCPTLGSIEVSTTAYSNKVVTLIQPPCMIFNRTCVLKLWYTKM